MDDKTFADLSPTTLADVLGAEHVMDIGIRPLWAPMPRVAGPAYTVRCAPGDNLMLHAAIHRVEAGSVIVVEAGVIPIPGAKAAIEQVNPPVTCGGVQAQTGDMVVADEEGIVVVPHERLDEVLGQALAKAVKDASQSLDEWDAEHRARIDGILANG